MDQRSPINWVVEDQGADVHLGRVAGRADRQRLRHHAARAAEAPRRQDHADQRRALEPARARGSVELDRVPRHLRRAAEARHGSPGAVRVRRSTRRSSARRARRRRCRRIASTASPTTRRRRRLFESEPRVRVLHGERRGLADAGAARRRASSSASRSGRRRGRGRPRWYFGPGGTLTSSRPRARTASTRYHPDPEARPMQTHSGTGAVGVVGGHAALRLASAGRRHGGRRTRRRRSTSDVTIVGPGSVDLWLRSSAVDTDLQVTLTEIRPDGLETYVQSGWLRASHRKLARKGQTRIERRARPISRRTPSRCRPGEFTKMRVGIFAVAHVFRAGSRIRISIEAPGRRSHALGASTPSTPTARSSNDVAHSPADAVAPRAAGRAGVRAAGGSAAVSGSPRPAVPHLRAGRQRRLAGPPLSR